jgi:hypothetical protein
MITPRQVIVSESCVCTGSLGKAELEAAAACIVLYHWEHSPDEWIPITRRQIADWIPRSALLARAIVNPYWKPDIVGFCEGGYIEGWDVKGPAGADIPGTLTQKFFDALERALPKIIFTEAQVTRDEPTQVEGIVTGVNTIDFENMGGPEVPCDAEK